MYYNSSSTDLKIFLGIIYPYVFSGLLVALDGHTGYSVYMIQCEVQTTQEIQNIIFVLASLYFAKFCALPSERLAIISGNYNENNDFSSSGLSYEKSL